MSISMQSLPLNIRTYINSKISTSCNLYPSRVAMNAQELRMPLSLAGFSAKDFRHAVLQTSTLSNTNFATCLANLHPNIGTTDVYKVSVWNISSLSLANKQEAFAILERNQALTKHPNATRVIIEHVNHKVLVVTCIDTARNNYYTDILTTVYNQSVIEHSILASYFAHDIVIRRDLLDAVVLDSAEAVRQVLLDDVKRMQEEKKLAEFKEMKEKFSNLFKGRNAVDQLTRESADLANRILSLEQDIRDMLKDKRELDLKLIGLQTAGVAEDEAVSAFFDFFASTQDKVMCHQIGGNSIKLAVKTPLLYWEDKYYAALVAGIKQGNYLTQFTEAQMELLNKIFITKEYTLNLCTQFYIQVDHGAVYVSRYTFVNNSDERVAYIPNPHIHHYDCWGDNGDIIRKCSNKRDFVGMYAQILSALSGIDLSDGAVCRKFFDDLGSAFRGGNIKLNGDVLIRKDKTTCSIADALKELEDTDPITF